MVASPEVIALASEWAGVGLVAPSFWVSHDHALEADPDHGIPLASARLIGGAGATDALIAPTLAAASDLRDLRVVWVRRPGDTSAMDGAMGKLEASIRRLIPQHGVEVSFTELLVPETLRDLDIPVPPPDWQQFVVEPRDRPAPAVSDSYYDAATAPRQGLHAALMIGGILGGTNPHRLAPIDSRVDTPWVIHPFTRAVRGADRVRRVTRAVVADRLDWLSAADVTPEGYFAPEPDGASEYIDDTVAWLRELDGGALRRHRPEVVLTSVGQSFASFLFEVGRFIVWALLRMFGPSRWKDIALAVRARIARRLEADDYGATIDPTPPTPAGLGLEDWDSREAEAQQLAAALIRDEGRADGRLPHPLVWQSLYRVVPSLIDGSSGPVGWNPRERFGRVFALAPQSVLRSADAATENSAEWHDAEGFPGNAELRNVRHVSIDEVASARAIVASALAEPLVTFRGPEGRVARTAQSIIDRARAEESERRTATIAELEGSGDPVPDDLPLLVRLRAVVVADLVLARLTSDFLSEMTPTDVSPILAKLQTMLRNGTWLVLATVAIGAGLAALLVRFGKELDALFAVMQVPYPTSWVQLASWLIPIVGAVLTAIFVRLYYTYHAYNEVGRRRLEYVEGRARAAVDSTAERNRLRNADRILSAWEDVLCSVSTRDRITDGSPLPEPADLPDALQVAEPDVSDEEILRVVIDDAIQPSWFHDALHDLTTRALDQDAREIVWSDEGLPGGPLAHLRGMALTGSAQREWWAQWEAGLSDDVVARLVTERRPVRPLSPARDERLIARDFRAEISQHMQPEYRPGSDYQELFDASEDGERHVAAAEQSSADFVLTPSLTSVTTVLITRRLRRRSVAIEFEAAPDDAHDASEGRA